jgi:hypothetical protein
VFGVIGITAPSVAAGVTLYSGNAAQIDPVTFGVSAASSNEFVWGGTSSVFTNTSSQIYYGTSTSCTVRITSVGWIDPHLSQIA